MGLDPVFLARIQFAFTVSFHIIFPAFTIGLASFLFVLEWRWLKTRDTRFLDLYKFWVKIFAIAFAMGVVSGVVLSYQFGTNWSVFSDKVGNILGPLLGYEVLTAFFLEASFLGVMLFGWDRVSPRMHVTSTGIVAVGTLVSSFWILSANSWMQTPTGFTQDAEGRFFPTSWWDIVWNPSFGPRWIHMILAAYLTTTFVVGGVGAWFLLKKKHQPHAQLMLKLATGLAMILTPLQILAGDIHGLNTFKHQPAKVAAMEGIWETEKGAGLRLFALPNEDKECNDGEITIPYLSSLILTHRVDGTVPGLKEWPREDRPPVKVVFWCFRVMVGLGFCMLGLAIVSAIGLWKGWLCRHPWVQRAWIMMLPSGFIALLAGWFVTEVGRQPYVVYGVMRTLSAVSPAIQGEHVALSLLCFVCVYITLFVACLYYMTKIVRRGFSSRSVSHV